MEGNVIDNCEKNRSYDHVSNFEWLPKKKCSKLQTQQHRER